MAAYPWVVTCFLFLPMRIIGAARYQVYNYTWSLKNQAGDIVHSSYFVGSSPRWDPIIIDLCWLALGADPYWGTPGDFWPQPQALETAGTAFNGEGKCNNKARRAALKDQLFSQNGRSEGFYVCPGPPHRDRSLNYKCGFESEFYCASWGCETTGDAYWKPSSSWDLITVKNYGTHTIDDASCGIDAPSKGWCNPLIINFTDSGRDPSKWTGSRALTWGLRLYKENWDAGLTFSLRLSKELPVMARVSIGPNPFLHNPNPISSLHSKGLGPENSVVTQAPRDPPLITPFQPTIPQGPIPSPRVILSILNASASALLLQEQMSNSSKYKECWMCFSASPPFYEGIALFGNCIYTSDSDLLYGKFWGFTLTTISGMGSCILGKHMLPPKQLLEICNHTFIIEDHHEYLLAPNYTYFACSSGLSTYIITSTFLKERDYCVLVQLFPRLSIHEPQDILNFWGKDSAMHPREKREPISAITLAVILGLGAAGTGTGIASLVTSQQNQQRYHLLSAAVDKDLTELREGLANLKDSVDSLAEVVLQNRRGLDLLFLQQGGLCAALKEECCVYVSKTGLVEDSLKRVKESLEKRKREREQQESWYKNWFSTSPWLSTLLPSILGPLVGLLLLISFGPWAFQRLTRFIKSQIDAVLPKNSVSVHYHHLETKGIENQREQRARQRTLRTSRGTKLPQSLKIMSLGPYFFFLRPWANKRRNSMTQGSHLDDRHLPPPPDQPKTRSLEDDKVILRRVRLGRERSILRQRWLHLLSVICSSAQLLPEDLNGLL